MVREVDYNGEQRFICEACGFTYKEQEWAEKCEDFCTTHGACSLDITRHADQMVASQ